MNIYTFTVSDQYINIRLDLFLSQQLPQYSRSFLQKLITDKNILVNDKKTKSNYKLRINDFVKVTIPCPQKLILKSENIDLNIIYEDNDIIIINKPQNMVVHPSKGHSVGTLVNGLLYHYGNNLSTWNEDPLRPGIVHRIDKNTSGILVVAKNNIAHQKLIQQIQNHTMTRIYHTIVLHNIKNDEGTIDTLIDRHPINRKKRAVVSAQGKGYYSL